MNDRRILTGVGAAIGLEVIYGFSFLFIQSATDVAPITAVLSWRYIVAFVFMSVLIVTGVFKVNLKGKPLKPLLLLSVLVPVIYFVAEALGVSYTSVPESGTFMALIPLATLLLSTLILKTPPTVFQFSGIVTSVLGILIIVLIKGMEATFNLFGYFNLAVCVFSYSLYAIYVCKLDDYTGIEKTYLNVVIGTVVFTISAVTEGLVKGNLAECVMLPVTSRSFLTSILYLGVFCSCVAYLCVNASVTILGANRAAAFAGLTTVISVLSGIVLLGDSFSLAQGFGTALVLCGLYVANMTSKKAKEINEVTS